MNSELDKIVDETSLNIRRKIGIVIDSSATLKWFRNLCIILGKPVEKFQGQFSAKSMIVILPEWCLDHHQHEPELENSKEVPTLDLSLDSNFEDQK